jgi:Rod binding domain-containing protein
MASIAVTPAAAGADGSGAAAPNPKLVRAAHEFEAQMMKELLKPMTAGGSLTGEDDGADADLSSGSGSGSALSEFASEALGKALSERGGFGIADRIVRDLSHSGNRGETGKVTGNQHGNTGIRTHE